MLRSSSSTATTPPQPTTITNTHNTHNTPPHPPLPSPAGNLLRSSAVSPPEAQHATLAGRKWLRGYVNGCAFSLWEARVPAHLEGQPFLDVAVWLYWTSGFVLMGACWGGSACTGGAVVGCAQRLGVERLFVGGSVAVGGWVGGSGVYAFGQRRACGRAARVPGAHWIVTLPVGVDCY